MSYQWVLCSALRNIHTRARPRESYPRAKQYSCLHRTQNPSKIDLTVDVKHIFENILLIHKVKKTICMLFIRVSKLLQITLTSHACKGNCPLEKSEFKNKAFQNQYFKKILY